MYAEVVFSIASFRSFTYKIPQNLMSNVGVGMAVNAPFKNKIQIGYIAKPTYINHFVLNDSFAKAVKNFTKLEEIEINKQIKFINTENSPYSNI